MLTIAVDKMMRKKGIASMLLKKAIEYLISQNVDDFRLEVGVSNLEALSLYSRFGFERTSVLEKYYSDGSDAVRMHLSLRSTGSKHD